MRVASCKTVCVEMCAVFLGGGDFGTERVHGEIVTPDLTVVRAFEDLSFERGLAIDTWDKNDLMLSL